ncbi:superoxide dismutase family protein [Luteimonas sp. RIT-PG2_3]
MRNPALKPLAALLVPAFLALAACTPSAPEAPAATDPQPAQPAVDAVDAAAAQPAPAASTATASVTLAPTQGNQTAGTLQLAVVDGAVVVTGDVTGLKPGSQHGFHLHEKGDCSAPDATSAGGHFNPASSNHGRVGQGAHHGGDSDNLVANDQGVATVNARFEGVTIGDGAATDVVGKGVIVHADADDYVTQPTGNAGARLACGVIASTASP